MHVSRSHVTLKAAWLFNVTFASNQAHWVPMTESSYLYTDSLVPGQGGSDLPLNWKSEALDRYCHFSSSTFISEIRFPGICCSWVPIMKWHRKVAHIRCSQHACKSLSRLQSTLKSKCIYLVMARFLAGRYVCYMGSWWQKKEQNQRFAASGTASCRWWHRPCQQAGVWEKGAVGTLTQSHTQLPKACVCCTHERELCTSCLVCPTEQTAC